MVENAKEISVEKEIELLHEVINAAINHGGDLGGAYFSDWPGLEAALGTWIVGKGLEKAFIPSNNGEHYIAPIKPYSMSSQLNEGARCIIAFDTFEVEQLENTGMVVSTSGIPFRVNMMGEDSLGRCQTFSTERERRYFYEIDYRKAESEGACVFYDSCDEGIRVYTIPSIYLKRCITIIERIESLIQETGYYIDSANWNEIILRKKDSKSYIALYRDGKVNAYREDPEAFQELLIKIHKLYWNE